MPRKPIYTQTMHHPDICIAGAGIIGLSLALELDRRGARVTVLERDTALAHASTAAAGMLAAEDPENPSLLQPLSRLSVALYPDFLSHIESLSGIPIPFQTSRTLQAHSSYPTCSYDPTLLPQLVPGTHHFITLNEHSIDPRQLAIALHAAVQRSSITLVEHTQLLAAIASNHGNHLRTNKRDVFCKQLVYTMGSWSFAPVTPRKGQMLTVALPPELPLQHVIRTPEIYIVPRTLGPSAGHALIGATVEEAGFDTEVHTAALARLRSLAAELLPQLADERHFPTSAQWAGLRPATPDALPLLGHLSSQPHQLLATGHYRNGILLAPATARVMAELLCDETPSVDLSPFAPSRFPAG